MFASCASNDVKAPDEDPQDRANELETEAFLEDQAQQERMEAKEEKLTAEAREQTEANEEFAIAQQEAETKWGPDNIERN